MVRLIEDPANDIWVSSLSVWECRIKQSKGKLLMPDNLVELVKLTGFSSLPFTARHADETLALPGLHSDPFDRGLLAQARCEGLALVTTEGQLAEYGEPVLFVG